MGSQIARHIAGIRGQTPEGEARLTVDIRADLHAAFFAVVSSRGTTAPDLIEQMIGDLGACDDLRAQVVRLQNELKTVKGVDELFRQQRDATIADLRREVESLKSKGVANG